MGRTNVFECEKCGYRAGVAGGMTEGVDVSAQTIHCLECKQLRDAVIAVRVSADAEPSPVAPPLESVIDPLQPNRPDRGRWDYFEPACVVDREHRVRPWNHPGLCPVCAVYMEPAGMPLRQWP